MRTSIKILLLLIFSIVAIGAVLMFAKTQVAPPSEIKMADQYVAALEDECVRLENITDFSSSRNAYIFIDDKIKRLHHEKMISDKIADENRTKIDETYGDRLISYGYSLFGKSRWDDKELNQMAKYIEDLRNDKLTNGVAAPSETFFSSADKIQTILSDYKDAMKHSRNTSYRSLSDAREKLSKASDYKKMAYLSNNRTLVEALDEMPRKISNSHFGYLTSKVNELGKFRTLSENYYTDVLIPQVNDALKEYSRSSLYGSYKKNIVDLENTAERLINEALSYYNSYYYD